MTTASVKFIIFCYMTKSLTTKTFGKFKIIFYFTLLPDLTKIFYAFEHSFTQLLIQFFFGPTLKAILHQSSCNSIFFVMSSLVVFSHIIAYRFRLNLFWFIYCKVGFFNFRTINFFS